MNLYIEIENQQTKNHPAFKNNLIQAFGVVPENWEQFIRIETPTLGVYEKFASIEPVYSKINGVWTDVWSIREMTTEEKTAKQQEVITAFNEREYASNWAAWTLDEVTCKMIPPIPRPEPIEGKKIFWCGADNNWKETPAYPADNNQYKFDFFAWQWVAL